MQDNIRLKAAHVLLNRGIRYKLSGSPLFFKLIGLHKIHIRPFKAGTIIEITRLLDERQIDAEKANQHIKDISLIISVAVLNSWLLIRLFSKLFSKILLWKIPAFVLTDIFLTIREVDNISDFMIITRYFDHQAAMMMNPRNLGQMEGS